MCQFAISLAILNGLKCQRSCRIYDEDIKVNVFAWNCWVGHRRFFLIAAFIAHYVLFPISVFPLSFIFYRIDDDSSKVVGFPRIEALRRSEANLIRIRRWGPNSLFHEMWAYLPNRLHLLVIPIVWKTKLRLIFDSFLWSQKRTLSKVWKIECDGIFAYQSKWCLAQLSRPFQYDVDIR